LPGATPERETALAAGELIVAVRIPAEAAGFARNTRYLKLRERTSYAFAVVSAAVALEVEDGAIRTARIALGGVAAKPWRAREAEASLTGRRPTAKAFAKAAELALVEARPSGDNAFKIELARRIVVRALTCTLEGTPLAMPSLPASPFYSTIPGVNRIA
jgi:xanthine dehydrogenase YagS FAD-binding subunit